MEKNLNDIKRVGPAMIISKTKICIISKNQNIIFVKIQTLVCIFKR